jgi:hypothetical protein
LGDFFLCFIPAEHPLTPKKPIKVIVQRLKQGVNAF